MSAHITVVDDEAAVAAEAADRLTSHVQQAIAARGAAVICLTGGDTVRRLYEVLADPQRPWRTRIDWGRVHMFWGDERHVPPDHADSNFGMTLRTLLAQVPVREGQVHRMRGELEDAAAAARAYETALRDGFQQAGRADQTFDFMLLGVGEDAHVASIFPDSPVLDERSVRVAAAWAPQLKAWRITLTPSALIDARAIVVVVAGEKKARAVQAAVRGPEDVTRWPAQLLRAAGDRVEWIVDKPAAALLQ